MPHGYIFEIDPAAPEGAIRRTPIADMGVFSHEAVGFDPETGIVYLTEDGDTEADLVDPSKATDGSFLYRFTPNDMTKAPDALQKGGQLKARKDVTVPTANEADLLDQGDTLELTWVEVDKDDSTADATAKDCLMFNRLEGASFAAGTRWFCDTEGGEQGSARSSATPRGQFGPPLHFEGDDTFGYEASDSRTDYARQEGPENITVTTRGDIIVAEDGGGVNRLIGFTPDGESYVFALHNRPYRLLEEEGLPANFRADVAGPTFLPDGKTLFVNAQYPGVTMAVLDDFPEASAERQLQMALGRSTRTVRPIHLSGTRAGRPAPRDQRPSGRPPPPSPTTTVFMWSARSRLDDVLPSPGTCDPKLLQRVSKLVR